MTDNMNKLASPAAVNGNPALRKAIDELRALGGGSDLVRKAADEAVTLLNEIAETLAEIRGSTDRIESFDQKRESLAKAVQDKRFTVETRANGGMNGHVVAALDEALNKERK